MDDDAFQDLLKQITRKQKVARKHNEELQQLLDQRDKVCPHTELEAKEYYNGGGYDYTSYSEYWNVCKCCGASSEKTRVDHGGYA